MQKSNKNKKNHRRRGGASVAEMVAVVSHQRCFSASSGGFSNLYAAFRCKQLDIGDVVIPEAIQEEQQEIPFKESNKESSAMTIKQRDKIPREDSEGVRRRMQAVAEMQAMVRALQFGDGEKSVEAAAAVRAAARRDGGARSTLALMGAIPPLVAMLDSPRIAANLEALLALLNLAVRNDQNKAAIVQSGAIPKILRLISQSGGRGGGGGGASIESAAAAALLSLSALDSNKAAIGGAAGAVEALVRITTGGAANPMQARRDAIGALYNLSIHPANAVALTCGGAVAAILAAVYEPELSWRAVATAANLAATPHGRRALALSPSSSLVFLDVLAATTNFGGADVASSAASQRLERAAYVVAAMAECSPAQRRAMSRGGAASVLLETVLLGSVAAQECASRALECLRDGECGVGDGCCEEFMLLENDEHERCFVEMELVSEERKAVNKLVQQSLKMNMDKICERACIPYQLNQPQEQQQQQHH